MPIGVGAALLIGSAVSGATAVGAAKLQSNAASKAQKAQQAATDKALQVNQQAMSPYTQLGQQAAGRLSAGPTAPYTGQFQPGSGNNGFQPFQPPPQTPQGPPPTLGNLGMPPGAVPRGGPQGPPQMVRLQAPDGSISPRPFSPQEAQLVMAQARAAGHELKVVN